MRQFFCTIVTVIVASLSLSAGAQQAEQIRIGVGGQASIYHLPLATALYKGYFKEQGLNVEVVDFAGGGKAMQGLVAGAVDIVSGAYEHTLRTQARGLATQAFVLASTSPQIAMAISSTHLPEYRNLKDLKGKLIGISAPGSSTQTVASLILGQAGIRPDEVSFVGLGTGMAAQHAFISGKVDALVNSEPLMSLVEQRTDVLIVADTRTPTGTAQLFNGAIPANVLLARTHFIEQHPQTIQRLTNAMVQALHWLNQASPEEITALIPPAWQLNDPKLYQRVFSGIQPSLSNDGRFHPDEVQNLLQSLYRFDPTLEELAIDSDLTWTNRFVDRAKYSAP